VAGIAAATCAITVVYDVSGMSVVHGRAHHTAYGDQMDKLVAAAAAQADAHTVVVLGNPMPEKGFRYYSWRTAARAGVRLEALPTMTDQDYDASRLGGFVAAHPGTVRVLLVFPDGVTAPAIQRQTTTLRASGFCPSSKATFVSTGGLVVYTTCAV
jgi:hypothetical protein